MSKKITLLVLVFISAILFWVAAEPWINSATKFSKPEIWILPLLGLIVLSSLIATALTVFSEDWLKNIVIVAVVLPAFVIFGFSWFLIAVLAINFLFHLVAIKRINNEKAGRLKISPLNISRKGLTAIIMPLLITVSFAYYLTPAVQQSVASKNLPPSVNQVVEKTVSGVLKSEIDSLPASEREKAKSDIIEQVNSFLENALGSYYKFLPPVLAFGLFLVLEGLSYLFIWPAVGLSVVLFAIMRRAGWVKIEKTQIEAERIV